MLSSPCSAGHEVMLSLPGECRAGHRCQLVHAPHSISFYRADAVLWVPLLSANTSPLSIPSTHYRRLADPQGVALRTLGLEIARLKALQRGTKLVILDSRVRRAVFLSW